MDFLKKRADPLEQVLAAAGLPIVRDRDMRLVRAECMRVARRLKLTEGQVFGLAPVDSEAAVPPVAIQLGISLMELGGSTVAFLDANTRLPALPPRSVLGNDEGDYQTRWVFESFALISPNSTATGELVQSLSEEVKKARELFQFVLVDLTGFEAFGELESASTLVDRIVVVAAAGKTREAELLDIRSRLGETIIGTLLVG